MVKRKRIGIVYSYSDKWIAGAYYIQNIIFALNTLPDIDKPEVIILTKQKKDFIELQNNVKYPYISFFCMDFNYSILERIINFVFRFFSKKNFFEKRPSLLNLDVLFPGSSDYQYDLIPVTNKLFWIPDFQEHYYPRFFNPQEIINRKNSQQALVSNNVNIVLSSNSALNDFNKIYPNNSNHLFTLPFAVTLPSFDHLILDDIIKKHSLPDLYFFAPNQFWQHKNHIVILKAIHYLKQNGTNLFVAFSGKEEEYRNPNYFKTLKDYISKNNIENNVFFLGFIDRREQLLLMKNAISILQPSLFEGWSTVVEDAKALNQNIILSNIDVHIEQNPLNSFFFNANDYIELAKIMQKIKDDNKKNAKDYTKEIKAFGLQFIKIINTLQN